MTPAEREAVKAGKRERIRKMLEKLRPPQPTPIDEELRKLLEVKEDKKHGYKRT